MVVRPKTMEARNDLGTDISQVHMQDIGEAASNFFQRTFLTRQRKADPFRKIYSLLTERCVPQELVYYTLCLNCVCTRRHCGMLLSEAARQ